MRARFGICMPIFGALSVEFACRALGSVAFSHQRVAGSKSALELRGSTKPQRYVRPTPRTSRETAAQTAGHPYAACTRTTALRNAPMHTADSRAATYSHSART